ncbi:MAG TPA: hypothetical protein VK675_04650 [Candidatus Paceibacterota bacterium]|nr:hypothetical protein [Candidatus Paceibacterota bacterium]
MSYDKDEDVDASFKMSAEYDEPEMPEPEVINDFGLDEEDPDRDT